MASASTNVPQSRELFLFLLFVFFKERTDLTERAAPSLAAEAGEGIDAVDAGGAVAAGPVGAVVDVCRRGFFGLKSQMTPKKKERKEKRNRLLTLVAELSGVSGLAEAARGAVRLVDAAAVDAVRLAPLRLHCTEKKRPIKRQSNTTLATFGTLWDTLVQQKASLRSRYCNYRGSLGHF